MWSACLPEENFSVHIPIGRAQSISFCHVGAQSSDPWNNMSHEVGVDPVDDADVHVCHLKRYGYLRVLRCVSVDDLSHHQDQANDG